MAQVGKDARRAGGTVRYERHRPETTLLYQLVGEYYPYRCSILPEQSVRFDSDASF